jgi:SAM-dependent methyltransferase
VSDTKDSEQGETAAYFDRSATYWRDVYAHEGLQASVYRRRQALVLEWVDALGLPTGARVLEAGCGAGGTTIELARRGFAVEAVDASREMVEIASQRVAEEGLADAVTVLLGDVNALPFPNGTFSLIVALGVLPWLHSPGLAIDEMARVVARGGHVILSADNRLRLNWLVEPAENPLAAPLKYGWRVARRHRSERSSPIPRLHSPKTVDRMLAGAGLEPERRATVGFGPFTFRWRPIFSDRTGLALDRALGRLAQRRFRPLLRAGWHYIVSARRP